MDTQEANDVRNKAAGNHSKVLKGWVISAHLEQL